MASHRTSSAGSVALPRSHSRGPRWKWRVQRVAKRVTAVRKASRTGRGAGQFLDAQQVDGRAAAVGARAMTARRPWWTRVPEPLVDALVITVAGWTSWSTCKARRRSNRAWPRSPVSRRRSGGGSRSWCSCSRCRPVTWASTRHSARRPGRPSRWSSPLWSCPALPGTSWGCRSGWPCTARYCPRWDARPGCGCPNGSSPSTTRPNWCCSGSPEWPSPSSARSCRPAGRSGSARRRRCAPSGTGRATLSQPCAC